ncbi:hypothetical protein O1O06_07940 [Grimontia hollisae]|uniref:hypothetical protein n=1 Tax=Grimontia hollisae TaxID=673 RepID=UPI0023DC4478|nr:hypothetical protein [Grimontia hollisae]MDF2184697.1 hypothetical protein [Grimontia hollisae]
MTSTILTDSDIKAFKRQAKLQKRQLRCSHMQALDVVARLHGFDSWYQVLKIAERSVVILSEAELTTTQRVLLDNSLYTSVPVGWLIGRKSYPDFSSSNDTAPSISATELEVPTSRWRGEKHG